MTNRADEVGDMNSLLFGGDSSLVNLKCFVGEGQPTEDELRTALASAMSQRKKGTALVAKRFNDDATKADIRALTAAAIA
jgi:hypothetical protein